MGLSQTHSCCERKLPSIPDPHSARVIRYPSSQEAAELAEALPGNTHLTELYASGHELDSASVQAIAAAVGSNQTLRTLCLGNSSFGDEGTAQLAEVPFFLTGLGIASRRRFFPLCRVTACYMLYEGRARRRGDRTSSPQSFFC